MGSGGIFRGTHPCHLRWSGLRAAQRAMGRRILDLLNDRAMSVSWNLPISVKLPESLREIIIWASGNIEQVEKELRNADRQFLEANRTFLIVFDALAWGETPILETALLSALSNIGVVEFRMEWRIKPSTQLFEPGCCRTPPPSSRRQRRAPRARAHEDSAPLR